MASVQELILAAQSQQKKHPLSMIAEVINAASSGYSEGKNLRNVQTETELRRAEIARKLVETQQMQQEMEAQKELRRQFEEKLAITAEQNLRSKQKEVGGEKATGHPGR